MMLRITRAMVARKPGHQSAKETVKTTRVREGRVFPV
jgi:hypothetical protein